MKKMLTILLLAITSLVACSQEKTEELKATSDELIIFEDNIEIARLDVVSEITVTKEKVIFRNTMNDSTVVFKINKPFNTKLLEDGSTAYTLRCIDEKIGTYVYTYFLYAPSGNLVSVAFGTYSDCMIFLIKQPNNKNL